MSLKSPRTAGRDDRGATALIIAASMFLLMGMAAIAVDAGAGFNERRLDQTAGDVSVMAGAINFGDQDLIVENVLEFARANLRNQFTDPEWIDLWRSCEDDPPANFFPLPEPSAWGSGGTIECISQSASLLRVRVPNQAVATSLARVIGFSELQTFARAVATLAPQQVGDGLLPFALLGGFGAGELCLRTAPGGQAQPPCDGPDAGSFGTIVSPVFGEGPMERTPKCTALTGTNGVLDDNMALGIDHVIVPYENSNWQYPQTGSPSNNTIKSSDANVDECQLQSGVAVATDGVPIDTVLIDTGNVVGESTAGLVSNSTYSTALGSHRSRLQQGTNTKITARSGNQNWPLDNRPLWDYLTSNAGSVVPSTYNVNGDAYVACDRNSYDSSSPLTLEEKTELIGKCLEFHETLFPEPPSNSPDAGVIFQDSISDSPRFAWAPQIWHDNFGSGQSWRPVHSYRMVFLGSTFFNCDAVDCGVIFHVGDPSSELCDPQGPVNCKQLRLDQMNGWAIAKAAIAKSVRDSFPFGTQGLFQPTLWR